MWRKPGSIVSLGMFALALTACGGGGGGGDEEAFCNDLDDLSNLVADGDLTDDRGIEDGLAIVNSMIDNAPSDALDGVNAVADEFESARPDDAEDLAETIQDELGGEAEDRCDLDPDEFAVFEVTTTTEPEETTTTEATEDTDGDNGGDTGGAEVDAPDQSINVLARQPVPADLEAGFEALADSCFDGDMDACDELFLTTPIDSVAEAYGATCAGRLDPDEAGASQCAAIMSGPAPFDESLFENASDIALADDCFDGDMVACDDLFNGAEAGSAEQLYGGLCGNRVPFTEAFCVEIFGDIAFN